MTDHLPECYWPDTPERAICICDRLRSCEQRVTERWESLRGWGESYAYKTGSDNGFDVGYAAGLDRAREAVAETQRWHEFSWGMDDDECGEYVKAEEALAAIDALREERE